VSIVTVMARKGKARAMSAALEKSFGITVPASGRSATGRDLTLHWCGAEQYYAVSSSHGEGELYASLRAALKGNASCVEQSHGRIIIRAEGPKVRQVLAKGTPVDLHPTMFKPGYCAVTQIAHVGVHLAQVGPDAFELSVFRGFAESFREWLTEQAEEFGYQVG
jgi:sarcosine oxidase subunit gamma